MKRRYERISKICKDLSEEAFKSYAGKRDYKRALEIYSLLATSDCVPSDISNFSKNMLGRLNKKIEQNILCQYLHLVKKHILEDF